MADKRITAVVQGIPLFGMDLGKTCQDSEIGHVEAMPKCGSLFLVEEFFGIQSGHATEPG